MLLNASYILDRILDKNDPILSDSFRNYFYQILSNDKRFLDKRYLIELVDRSLVPFAPFHCIALIYLIRHLRQNRRLKAQIEVLKKEITKNQEIIDIYSFANKVANYILKFDLEKPFNCIFIFNEKIHFNVVDEMPRHEFYPDIPNKSPVSIEHTTGEIFVAPKNMNKDFVLIKYQLLWGYFMREQKSYYAADKCAFELLPKGQQEYLMPILYATIKSMPNRNQDMLEYLERNFKTNITNH